MGSDIRITGCSEDKWGYWKISWRDYDARKSWLASHPEIVTYEADLSPSKRLMADYDIAIQRPKRCYLDIETDSRVSVVSAVEGGASVLSWAVVGEDGREHQGCLIDDERRLLENLLAVLEDYDQIVGWNSDEFDRPVIEARAKGHGIWLNRRHLWLDYMLAFKRMNLQVSSSGDEKQSFALNAICQAILGEGKNDFDSSKTYEAWAGPLRAEMLAYNLQDTRLLKKLEDKTQYLDAFQTICQVCHIFPHSHSLKPTQQMDGYFLRLAKNNQTRLPTKKEPTGIPVDVEGAYVMPPTTRGILKDVSVLDFSAMYPSILQTFNLSFDTKVDETFTGPTCITPINKVRCRTDKVGFFPQALFEFAKLRKGWKAKKAAATPGSSGWKEADRYQNAYKVLMNSAYGIILSPYSRFYDPEIGLGVTSTGQWMLKDTIQEINNRGWDGWKAVYGDTDSVYLCGTTQDAVTKFAKWLNEEHLPELAKAQGCVTCTLNIEYQEVFSRLIFPLNDENEPSAKRYAGRFAVYQGRTIPDSEIVTEIKGLEFMRGDCSRLARGMQKEIVDLLMAGEADVQVYEDLVLRWMNRITVDGVELDDIVISKGVKPIEEYAVRKRKDGTTMSYPAHVQVAQELIERGQNPHKVRYVIVDATTSPMTIVPADDFTGEFDRHHTWLGVYAPSMRLLAGAFATRNWYRWIPKRGKKPLAGQISLALG